jgi:hypothetical protein
MKHYFLVTFLFAQQNANAWKIKKGLKLGSQMCRSMNWNEMAEDGRL